MPYFHFVLFVRNGEFAVWCSRTTTVVVPVVVHTKVSSFLKNAPTILRSTVQHTVVLELYCPHHDEAEVSANKRLWRRWTCAAWKCQGRRQDSGGARNGERGAISCRRIKPNQMCGARIGGRCGWTMLVVLSYREKVSTIVVVLHMIVWYDGTILYCLLYYCTVYTAL